MALNTGKSADIFCVYFDKAPEVLKHRLLVRLENLGIVGPPL